MTKVKFEVSIDKSVWDMLFARYQLSHDSAVEGLVAPQQPTAHEVVLATFDKRRFCCLVNSYRILFAAEEVPEGYRNASDEDCELLREAWLKQMDRRLLAGLRGKGGR